VETSGSSRIAAVLCLIVELIEGHIRFSYSRPKIDPTDEQTQAADDLIHALRAYFSAT